MIVNEHVYRYRLKIAYDGQNFGGWQIQPNSVSIQQKLQEALSIIFRKEIHPIASGRTDAGVHAKGQIAHFDIDHPIRDLKTCLRSINGLLPYEIRVIGLEACQNSFHARYSAKRKIYHYNIHTDGVESPFTRRYRWFIPQKMDHNLLLNACQMIVGTHDFRAFANENHQGVAAKDSIRTLYRLDCVNIEGGICLEYEGDGFLYKMVRNCTGLIIEVVLKKRPLEDISRLLNQPDRKLLGYCAPAHGLFLEKVIYEPVHKPSTFLEFENGA